MKIAVAGGLGFVGSYIVPRLISAGHDVTVFDSRKESSSDSVTNLHGYME